MFPPGASALPAFSPANNVLSFLGAPNACQVGNDLGSAAATSGHHLELLQGLTGLGASASARQRLGQPAASVRSRAQLLQRLDVSASAWQRLQDLREPAVWHRAELVPLPTDISNKQEDNTGQSKRAPPPAGPTAAAGAVRSSNGGQSLALCW